MSLRTTRAQDISLGSLLEGVDAGQVVLPDFQRDFDWTDADVRSLLGTVLSGWPVGSLLLIEGTNDLFAARPVEGAPPAGLDVVYVILDGQQRLTALYQALYDRGPLVFALRLSALMDDRNPDIDTLDDSIVSVHRDVWKKVYDSPEHQIEADLLPVSALRSAADFFAWRDKAVADETQRQKLTDLYRSFLSGLHGYSLPAVIIDRDIDPAAVARIFERVNRSGMTLGTFDLMVARSFTKEFNLRLEFQRLLDTDPLARAFLGDDGLPILAVIALRHRESIRQSAVLNLPGGAVRDGWDRAAGQFSAALRYAATGLGVHRPEWLPYKPILTVLAAMSYEVDLRKNSALVDRWFWATALGQRYSVASNTRAVADYNRLVKGEDPVDRSLLFVRETLFESTRQHQGALHRGFLCALADKILSNESSLQPWLIDSSLFDRSMSIDNEYDPPLHLRTLSFVLHPEDSAREPLWRAEDQFLGGSQDLSQADVFDGRLKGLQGFSSEKIGEPVRVISEEEYEQTREVEDELLQ